jgi:hypothetical protein
MKTRKAVATLSLALAVAAPTTAFAQSSASATPGEQSGPTVEVIVNSPEAVAEKAEPAAPDQLVAIKNKAAAEIGKRQKSLGDWSAKLATAKADCGQNSAAASRIASTQANLVALGSSIQAATDKAVAKPLYRQIFTHQRVYLVVGPVVSITIACGNQYARADKLNVELTELLAKANSVGITTTTIPASTVPASTVPASTPGTTAVPSGVNTAAALALLNQVAPLITAGKASAASASAAVQAIVPDQGTEAVKASNAATVTAAKNQIKQADASLDKARALLNEARKTLNGAIKQDKLQERAEKKAEKEAEKAEKKAEKAAEKADKEAKKAERKAEREAEKAKRKGNK